MTSASPIDPIPLERLLHDLAASIRETSAEASWASVETTARELANNLRVRNANVDIHTILGKTELPQTLTSLLASGLAGAHIPDDSKTGPLLEILRVGANLCMDHNENRAALLEVTFPQSVLSILEAYADRIPSPPGAKPLPLSNSHLKIVRTSIGVLLNASIGFDLVKARLTSLEAARTIIKLSSTIYPPTSWTSCLDNASQGAFVEEWDLRSGISNWSWRTVSALRDGQDENLQIINPDVLPWITAPLIKFCLPQADANSPLARWDEDMLDNLVQTDFDFLEESCTLIEALSLDVEEFRLELARATCYTDDTKSVSCLNTILDFIEHGAYPPLWKNPVFSEADRKNKEKAFDICKAALIKAVVEVFGEEKNEDVLWTDGKPGQPGGPVVEKFVQWIRGYVEHIDANKPEPARDDMAICASLSLGNLVRKANIATALLSPPYSLAPILASPQFISTSTDIKLKHGILGLLKHLSQFSKHSPIIPASLAEVGIIDRIARSGIWDEKSDAMADVIQLSAISVAKHMCHASLDHAFALVLPTDKDQPTGLLQILALVKRSDSVSIKSEGSRVLVTVVKTVWLSERITDQQQKKREQCMSILLTAECAKILTGLIARSNKYPLLVNEGIVAISLLSTHKVGAPLVIEALTTPPNGDAPLSPSTSSDIASALPTPSSRNDGLPVPRHALDMLIFVLRNVDNPVNFPIEVRINTCTFFSQLQRHVSAASLASIKDTVIPVVQQVIEDAEDVPEEEKLVKAANLLLENWKRSYNS
ncbi:hypothetical protein BDN70DRAFT_878010 [Pholiota conissans]|uniref:ARM repeat superfamily protein n=1 Tax=Pholiota conissans TaxID=109636 RepID=A0A9P5Z2V4_9AGAR|nr:hypothetical protein BDN70DRAFT_878010 [Pholiota conissans]